MKLLELFCGTKSISKIFKNNGHYIYTVDIDEYHKPDLCIDILDFPKLDVKFDVIWASPPCTTFSVMSNFNYWDFPYPKNSKAAINLAYVLKTLEIIEQIKPTYWFIENPVGLLRKFKFMKKLPRKTVNYCQYGTTYMKPTDIWTNAVEWVTRKRCSKGETCHQEPRRGIKYGVQGIGFQGTPGWSKEARIMRSIIPEQLAKEIYDVVIGNINIKQEVLI